ncbi:MAG: bifunctional diaminohydroxyphosphoribosylaminopyrimidine deaminase/5-amino-6-(5-phosphoribosylamino)uracil reductase RibD [Pseudomonadales bacterium]
MTVSAVDRLYLRAAIRLAEKGLFSVTTNNPRVGCLLVKDGRIIGQGWHRADGGPHAETDALGNAIEDPRGSTAYVSLEPCCWKGRTPPCTTALIKAGIARTVIAARDPHPRVAGGGVRALLDAGMEVTEEDLSIETRALNPGPLVRAEKNRPFVRLKIAISLDGRTAMANGQSRWITGEAARADVQYWRARSAAIVTGVGTVIADDPKLNVRDPRFGNAEPLRVVLDTHGRTPPDAALFGEKGRVVIACAKGVELINRAEMWEQQEGAAIDLSAFLETLADQGCNEVLVEAGATLNASFLSEGLWDEMIVYMAPLLMGDTARPLAALGFTDMDEAISSTVKSIETLGPDLRIILIP